MHAELPKYRKCPRKSFTIKLTAQNCARVKLQNPAIPTYIIPRYPHPFIKADKFASRVFTHTNTTKYRQTKRLKTNTEQYHMNDNEMDDMSVALQQHCKHVIE